MTFPHCLYLLYKERKKLSLLLIFMAYYSLLAQKTNFYQEAKNALRLGNLEKAEKLFEKAKQEKTKFHKEIKKELIKLKALKSSLKKSNIEEIRSLLQDVKDTKLWSIAISHLYQNLRIDDALVLSEEFLENYPKDRERPYVLYHASSILHYQFQKSQDALLYLDDLLKHYPKHPIIENVHRLLVDIYLAPSVLYNLTRACFYNKKAGSFSKDILC